MKGMLDPIFEEQVIGHAVVRQTFKAPAWEPLPVPMCWTESSREAARRESPATASRFSTQPGILKRFKDDVKEVAAGYECGLVFEKFNDLQEDDMIEAYAMVEVPR